MSFPPYPAYKDSGVPWLGDVPAHWDVLALKRLFTTVGEKAIGREFPVALEHIESGTGRLIEGSGEFEGDGVAFRGGDILYGKLRPYLAKTWLADRSGEAVGDVHVMRPTADVVGAFYRDLLLTPSVVSVLNGSTYGAKMPRVSWDFLGMMPVVRPPEDEQRDIVVFVDAETAKLDAVVAEQEALLGLLDEKRQAAISHVVFNGLAPDVRKKASGVSWVGSIPDHWDVVPFRQLASKGRKTFVDGDWIESPYITTTGVRLLQTGNVGVGRFKEQGFRYITEETFTSLGCTEVCPGDLLVCRLAGPVGRACIAPDLDVKMITSVDVAILKPAPDVDVRYFVHLLSSAQYLGFIEGECRGGTRDRISRSFLGALRMPKPPLIEQQAIVAALDAALADMEALATEARANIALLRERRAALISAAVTGKIDVRHAASASRDARAAA